MKFLNSLKDNTLSSCGPVALYNLLHFKNINIKPNYLHQLENLCNEQNGWTKTSGISKALNTLSKQYNFKYQYISKAKAPQAIQHMEAGKPLILLHFERGEGHYIFMNNFKENGLKKLEKMKIRNMMSKIKNKAGVAELWLIS